MKTVIFAFGEEKYMKSQTPKILHKLLDKPMISYVIEEAKKLNSKEILLVVESGSEEIKKIVEKDITEIVEISKIGIINGMASIQGYIDNNDQVLFIYGNMPLTTHDVLQKLAEKHNSEDNGATIITTSVLNSIEDERIIRVDESLSENDEYIYNDEPNVREMSVGACLFKGSSLNFALSKTNEIPKDDYSIANIIEILLKNDEKVGTTNVDDINEFFEINDRVQLAKATTILQERINIFHMLNGVTIVDPRTTYIGQDVTIGFDTTIYPGTILEGNTEIGNNCNIGANSKLTNVKIGDYTHIEYSVLKNSTIGTNTSVGPFAYVRPDCQIGSHCKIGDFVEVKNSKIGDKSKASHLTYIGDSEVGSHVNFGCGTVTVNYNGKVKGKTIIKDNVFIGCNTNLIAPVTVEEDSFIAAGSTITLNVPAKSLSIARARQINKEGWILK